MHVYLILPKIFHNFQGNISSSQKLGHLKRQGGLNIQSTQVQSNVHEVYYVLKNTAI